MNNKTTLAGLLFIILIALVIIYFCGCFRPAVSPKLSSVVQGTTTLSEGIIKMKIWDNNTEDGDSVKVYLDKTLIKDSLALLYEPLELNFGKLSIGEHLLEVVAINEGTTSPASATISFGNDAEKTNYEMNATVDSAAAWKLIIQ